MAIDKSIPVRPDKMFDHYLYKIKLCKETMSQVQYNEMKKSFFAALASMIVIFTQTFDEPEIYNVLDGIESDVAKFWKNQKV